MKGLAGLLLLFLLGTMFTSLFHMTHMDMSMGMVDCPFMMPGEGICPMDLAEHVGAWKTAFQSVIPTLVLLLVSAGMATLVASVAPNLLRRVLYFLPPPHSRLPMQIYTFSHRPLQELFSNGILNPKVY